MDFQSSPPSSPFTPRLPHPPLPAATTTNTLGILSAHLIPSLTLHTTLSLAAYSAGRFTNRLDAKDLLWPSAFVGNVWYHGVVWPYMVGRGRGVGECLVSMGYAQKLILGGVTIWGSRLFWKAFWRVKSRGRDDGRYERHRRAVRDRYEKRDDEEVEREMWNKAFLGVFAPEAVVQSLVSLGWSSVAYSAPVADRNVWLHAAAVGVFAAGLALEVVADSQLQRGKRQNNGEGMVRDGVWSIVRHPNYLGDFLVHLSFPLLALADGVFNPAMLVGPLANYLFLRFVGGDCENERYQMDKYGRESPRKHAELMEWRQQKNSFWPGLQELLNPWTYAIVGIGAVTAGTEYLLHRAL